MRDVRGPAGARSRLRDAGGRTHGAYRPCGAWGAAQAPPPRFPATRRRRRMRPYGPLRGRDDELSTALAVVRRTRTHGASGVVLISGNAGVGMTALLSEICRQAAHMNIRLARSKCDEIEQACPGAPMVGLLRTGRDPLLSAPEFQEINALTAEPLLLVDRTAGHLARLADGLRVLVAVDDVQWADRVSRYALRALITRLVGVPVVWILTS